MSYLRSRYLLSFFRVPTLIDVLVYDHCFQIQYTLISYSTYTTLYSTNRRWEGDKFPTLNL